MKQTLLYIAPHLSTGGMPQYLYAQIEAVINDFNVYCIEWNNVTGGKLVVQRNKVQELLKNRLITLSENKDELFTVINDIRPDIIHIQESPEGFMSQDIAHKLYASPRPYVLIETSHDSTFNVQTKQYLPDKFLLVSQHQIHKYAKLGIPYEVVPYPIIKRTRTKIREQALLDLGLDPNKKHVVNVGLFTPNKNQAEIVEYARLLQYYPIQFHFIGNQADNFRDYWEPLMRNLPSNCTWWNERSDVDTFYEMADLFLFTSKLELMPLVVREALGWELPSMIYNLPPYAGEFDKYPTIEYLTDDLRTNAYRLAEKLFRGEHIKLPAERVYHTMKGEEYLERLQYYPNANDNGIHYGDGAGQYYATYIVKELERDNVIQLNAGDVFVDLGGNIGMSSRYAYDKKVSEIHAFEPDPDMQKILSKNVPSAIIHPHAISNTAEEITLYHWPYNERNIGPTYTTSTITLRDVMKLVGKKINYLKIDIEGFERHLFDDVTPEECAQIEKMMIEYHDLDSLDTFCNILRMKGFEIVHLVRGYQAFIYAKYVGVAVTANEKNSRMTQLLDSRHCPNKREMITLVNTLFPTGIGAEIGVLRGEYSKTILERWHKGTLYLIDTWRHIPSYIDYNGQDDQYHYDCMVKTCENIKPWQHRAHMIRMDSVTSADIFPDEYFDFIYIDADHSYEAVVRDLDAWWPKIKKGGLFCGDDYIPDNGDIWFVDGDKKVYAGKFGVRQAVDEFSVTHNVKIYFTTDERYFNQWYTFKPF